MAARRRNRRLRRAGEPTMGQNFAKPRGVLVFRSLEDAVRNGFQVYDRASDYLLVRAPTSAGWAFALVCETLK